MDTAEVLASSVGRTLHLLGPEIRDAQISKHSVWRDERWILDNLTPGAGPWASTIKWDFGLPDGSKLSDPANEPLLDWLKRFVWSLYAHPADGVPLSPGTAPVLSTAIRALVTWMVSHGASKPDHLTPSALDTYLHDLPEMLASDRRSDRDLEDIVEDDDESEGIGQSQVWSRINLLFLLWKQRYILSEAGIAPMPAEPWDGRSALDLARHVATRALGWIKPLPDEVTIPLLNRAAWFLGQPAEDIIAAQTIALCSYREGIGNNRGEGRSKSAGKARQRAALERFQFSTLEGDNGPWHPNLRAWSEASELDVNPAQRLRQLAQSLASACAIVILAGTGMRISELCGLAAGIHEKTGLPKCVRTETSATGLNKLFLVRSPMSKTERTPREVDWVIGLEPVGSGHIPLAVRAILILQRLLEPYRSLGGEGDLFVSLRARRGLPKQISSVRNIRADALRIRIKDFVADWVDLSQLPDESARRVEDNDLVAWRESRGRIIKTHQFRKMFANFALSIDPRLLPAVQTHFHHLSQAMTEGGYWGKNRAQVEPLSSVRAQQLNQMLFDVVTNRASLAGRMGEHLQENFGELRARTAGKSTSETWREVVRFSNENDLRIWFSAHGACLPAQPRSMRCHDEAGTSSWLNREPNYSTREASLCAGCKCFILDKGHKAFWEERYVENTVAYRRAERAGQADAFRVVRERGAQSHKLLLRIGTDISRLDGDIERQLAAQA